MNADASDRRALAPRAAVVAAGVWTAIEYLLRGPCTDLLVDALRRAGHARSPAGRFTVAAFLVAPITGTLTAVFARRVRREGLSWSALGYACDRRRLVAGILAGIACLMMTMVTGMVDASLFTRLERQERFIGGLHGAGTPALAALLLGNGALVPVAEEFAWRGYIQSRLNLAWGPIPAVVMTAVFFALKHVIVDWSLTRVTTLITGALALGIIGNRYGTAASTAAHIVLNFTATAAAILSVRLD